MHDTSALGGSVGTFMLGDGTTTPSNGSTVTYEFFTNNTCSGTTHTDQTVTVAANGTVPAGNAQTLGAGSYSYLAIYSGNANYTSQTAACEPFAISKDTPSATTTLHDAATLAPFANGTALANGSGVFDVATVTTSDSFPLSGTVTFQFFANGTCTGSPTSTQTGVALSGGSATSSNQLSLATGSYSFDAQYVAGSDANHSNSAVSGCEPFSVNAPPPSGGGGTPAISITKNPKTQSIASGATANFTIVVTNTGTLVLTNVSVSDPLSPNCNQTSTSLTALASMAPGSSVTYNCSLANVTASFTNVATTTGTGSNGQTVTATDSAPVTVQALTPPVVPAPTPHSSIGIVKDPASQTIGQGGTAKFTITVTNTGDTTLSNVTVSDPLSTGCDKKLGTLAVGQSKSYSCTKTGVAADFQNVATATGKPPTTAAVKATDHANITVAPFIPPQHPKIAIVKSPKTQTLTTKLHTVNSTNGSSNTIVTYGTAHFTIKVTNTGDVTLHNVKVTDPSSPGCDKTIGSLASHASKTYSCTRSTVRSNFTNVATAHGTSPKGKQVEATDHAKVTVKVKTTSTSGAKFTG